MALPLLLITLQGLPVVSEVMADPLLESSAEFVEIFNNSADSVDLSGWSLCDGDALDQLEAWVESVHGVFPHPGMITGTTVLAPGACALVFELDYPVSPAYPSMAPGTLILTTGDASICNGLAASTDPMTLFEAAGTADSNAISTYGTPVPSDIWQERDDDLLDGIPFDPGDGYSVQRIFVNGPDAVFNWQASLSEGGSPGLVEQQSDSASVELSWLTVTPSAPSPEAQYELAACISNTGSMALEGSEVTFFLDNDADSSADAPEILLVVSSGTLEPGGADTLTFITTAQEGFWLAGATVFHADDSDDSDNTALVPFVSGSPDGPSITEVCANPFDEDCDEFVEFFFAGPGVFHLTGCGMTDGDALDIISPWSGGSLQDPDAQPGEYIASGCYAVLLDPEYAAGAQPYDFPAGAIILGVANTTLGDGLSGNDPLVFYSAAGTLVDDVLSTYGTPVLSDDPLLCDDDGLDGIPFDPGQGLTVSRVLPSLPDLESSWATGDPTPGSPPQGIQAGVSMTVSLVTVEPPRGAEGCQAAIGVSLSNTGTDSLAAGALSLLVFGDADLSGTPGEGEIILEQQPSSPVPGETLVIEAAWIASGGVVPVIACISCAGDTLQSDDTLETVWNRPLDLVINEMMYSPLPAWPEWFELYNGASQARDLSQYIWCDSNDSTSLSDQAPELASGAYAIVTSDSAAFLDLWPEASCQVLQPPDWLVLNDQTQSGETWADDIRLLMPGGQTADWVPYDDSWGGGGGTSLERIAPALEGHFASSWAPCATGGTPGTANSMAGGSPGGPLLSFSPDPFSPDGDGFDDVLQIELCLPTEPAEILLEVYNVQGRLVRTLDTTGGYGQNPVFSWDGLDNDGGRLSVGRYIVRLRAEGTDGEVRESSGVVVLARHL